MTSARRSGTVFWLHVLLDCEELDPTETLLLIALADHVDEHDQAFPSLQLLARRARISYATAKRRMADLEARGYIARTRRHGKGGRRSTYRYQLQRGTFGIGAPSPGPDLPLGPPTTRAQVEPRSALDRVQSAPRSRAHQGEPTEVPSVELEEEEQPDPAGTFPQPDDTLVSDLAQRLLELRNTDLPGHPVGQVAGWLKQARRRLRNDPQLPRQAQQIRHPALGCHGDPARHVDALAHRQRTAAWPTVTGPRRLVEPDPAGVHIVDTPDRTRMPTSVRDALTGGRR